jgi:hypothetical protein
MAKDIVRVLRVLEYVGPRRWVAETLARNSVKGTKIISEDCFISEAVIGDYPEILKVKEEEPKSD